MKVSQIMSKDVEVCGFDDNLAAAASRMWDCDIGCLPVVDAAGQVAGMVTDRDICMAALTCGQPLHDISVLVAMGRIVRSCTPDATLIEAEEIMRSAQVRRLPVIDSDGALVGIGFATFGYLRGRRSLRLLARGRTARGRLVEEQQALGKVNNRRVFALTFAFETEHGEQHRTTARTHRPELLEDQAEELLLYDPRAPARATLLDHLPGKPKVGDDGQLTSGSGAPPWLYLSMPVACALTNVVFFLMY